MLTLVDMNLVIYMWIIIDVLVMAQNDVQLFVLPNSLVLKFYWVRKNVLNYNCSFSTICIKQTA